VKIVLPAEGRQIQHSELVLKVSVPEGNGTGFILNQIASDLAST
jgi:hypothetical protein